MSSTIGRKVYGLTIPRCSIGMVKRAGINSSNADYLKWLRDIGYAEDPRYIQAVVQVMKQHL